MSEIIIKQTRDQVTESGVGDLMRKIKELVIYFLRNWKIILLAGVIGGVVGYFSVLRKKATYTADLTFIVEDGKSGGGLGASYSNLASQFGLDMGGAAGGLYQGDNLIEFLRSRLIIEKVLLTPYPVDKSKSMADVFFEMVKMKESWDQEDRTKNIKFPPGVNAMSLLQDSAMRIMYDMVIARDRLSIDRSTKKSTFIKVSFTSTDQYFSKALIENIVKEATDFYVQTKTARSLAQVNSLQRKSDSLFLVLNRKTYNTARMQDLNPNPNPALSIATVGVGLTLVDKTVLQTIYSEVVRNLEVAKNALAQDSPLIQMIDTPRLPLTMFKERKLTAAIKYAFGFTFACMLVLLLFRALRRSEIFT